MASSGYSGITVDVAVMEQGVPTVVGDDDSHILTLSTKKITYCDWKAIFYKDNLEFSPQYLYQSDTYKSDVSSNAYLDYYINNSNRLLSSSSLVNNISFKLDHKFILEEILLQCYMADLNMPANCWDTCSRIEFQKSLSNIKTLLDVGGSCNVNCSLTIDEFFNLLESRGLTISKYSGLPLDISAGLPYEGATSATATLDSSGAVILKQTVSTVITAKFASSTPNVKDVKVRWPFMIDFSKQVADDDSAVSGGLLAAPTKVNGEANTPEGANPRYDRYSANKFSRIN